MGQRISYFKNNYNKKLKDLLFENFDQFSQWYLATDKSSIEEFNEPFGIDIILKYLNQNPDFKSDFNHLEGNFIDEITSEFIGSYFDLTHRENNILEFFGPTMSTWRYYESDKIVQATKDKDFIRLWNFLIKGRSLKDNSDFKSITDDYKIGFLNREEISILQLKIEFHFGINHSSLTKSFFQSEQKAGLGYFLEAISELTDYNAEIITGIE